MAADPLSSLPSDARVWVFASSRDLSADDRTRLGALMARVLDLWERKSPGTRGAWEILEDRFLVAGCDERAGSLDGCAVDAMVTWARNLEREAGLRLMDRAEVFWRGDDGLVRSAPRAAFRALVGSGAAGPETRVFDTAIGRASQLARFELPLAESWHAEIFAPGARREPRTA